MNRGYLMNNLSDKLGISIAGYVNQYSIIKRCIESCLKLLPRYIGVSIDNQGSIFREKEKKFLDIFYKVDTVSFVSNLVKIKGGHWVGQHLLTILTMKEFNPEIKYVLLINGDCVINKGSGFHEILREFSLKGFDLLPTACYGRRRRICVGTMGMIAKIDSSIKILSKMKDFLVNEVPTSSGNEERVFLACEELGLKISEVTNPDNVSFCPPVTGGMWAEKMGFLHLHNEGDGVKYEYDGWWRNEKDC